MGTPLTNLKWYESVWHFFQTYVFRHALVYLLLVLLTSISMQKMDGRLYRFDGFENALASYYLATQGQMTLDGQHPSNFREPVPIVFTALHLRLFTDIPRLPLSGEMLGPIQQGERISQMDVRYPKEFLRDAWQRIQLSHVLIPFVFGSMVLLYFLARMFTEKSWLAGVVVLIAWLYFFNSAYFLYRPMTEYFITFFLLALSLSLVRLLAAPGDRAAFFSGLMFGLAALTKASVFYAALGVIPVLGFMMHRLKAVNGVQAWRLTAMLASGLLLVTLPWMARNYVQLGTASLSDRGGQVLLTRAFKNQMTSDEYKAAYFVYAPYELKTLPAFRHLFGFDDPKRDLTVELQRLIRSRPGDAQAAEVGNVDGAISFFHKAVAYARLQMRLHPEDADQRVKAHALELIQSNLFSHLKTMPLYVWRGIWSFGVPDPVQSYCGGVLGVVLNVCCFVSFLCLPIYAWVSRRVDLLIVFAVPWGLFWFYASFSHFVPRYSAPMIPFAVLSLVILISAMCRAVRGCKRTS